MPRAPVLRRYSCSRRNQSTFWTGHRPKRCMSDAAVKPLLTPAFRSVNPFSARSAKTGATKSSQCCCGQNSPWPGSGMGFDEYRGDASLGHAGFRIGALQWRCHRARNGPVARRCRHGSPTRTRPQFSSGSVATTLHVCFTARTLQASSSVPVEVSALLFPHEGQRLIRDLETGPRGRLYSAV